MKKSLLVLFAFGVCTISTQSFAQCADWLNHNLKKVHSDERVDLCSLTEDQVVLIVNTASHCGFTPQFKGLEALYQAYQDKGLVVVGFPSNSFFQAAKSEAESAKVCYENYGVSFPVTQPVLVKGNQAHPIFKHLSAEAGAPRWNFNKYLVDKNGVVIKHFQSSDRPDSPDVRQAVEALL